MGAADVVPGVSGGTVAFITGIYEELLSSIKSIDYKAFQLLFSGKFKDFWKQVNGSFLLTLFSGIFTAIFTLAKLILFLLSDYPIHIWAFFFGLIIASAILMVKTVKQWKALPVLTLIIGCIIAYYIAGITTVATENSSLFYIFLCGAIAICAMILPGISGSFILLLMGAYELVIGTIKTLGEAILNGNFQVAFQKIPLISVFVLGCLVGLASFSRFLTWLFKHFHDAAVALLTGFLIGSLNKVWPWKETLEAISEKHKIEVNISPARFEAMYGENYLLAAAILCLLGLILVLGIEKLALSLQTTDQN